MPNRIIRESCRFSTTLDGLSDGAERMFWRLTTVADDFGRFEAHPRILLAQCFPLWVGKMRVEKITAWWLEIVEAGLAKPYRVGDKLLGYFPTWDKYQRVRSRLSKFPAPPDAAVFPSIGDLRAIPTEVRNQILLRDRMCLACYATEKLVIDHIVPVVEGGTADEANLQTLCQPCNSAKHDQTLNFLKPGDKEADFVTRRKLLQLAASCGQARRNASEESRSRGSEESRIEESGKTADAALPFDPPANGANNGQIAGTVAFRIPVSIVNALDRAPRLGKTPKLRDPGWWQAVIRAFPGVDYDKQVLEAEAWCASNPTRAPKKDNAAFLYRWLRRSAESLT